MEIENALLPLAGTGEQGYQIDLDSTPPSVELRHPVGMAAMRSMAFISDTDNHRIIWVPTLEYTNLGCFVENPRAPLIPSIENHRRAEFVGDEQEEGPPKFKTDGTGMSTRPMAVYQCAKNALKLGYTVFAVRNGGECAASYKTDNYFYRGEGQGYSCSRGLGAENENDVYRLVPGAALDLVGKFYFIAGQAYSTLARHKIEEPVAGYYGDDLSSWVSSVERPQHLALDAKSSGNMYFVDQGNRRIRVLFGTLGPHPWYQPHRCVNTLHCTLEIKGNALAKRDQVGFIKRTKDSVCGRQSLETAFPTMQTMAVPSKLFMRKDYQLGTLFLDSAGEYLVCYCNHGGHRKCETEEDFEFVGGILSVVGPNANQHVVATAGVPFDALILGHSLSDMDRLRIVHASIGCGGRNTSLINNTALGMRAPDEGSETYELWKGIKIGEASSLLVCWCSMKDGASNCTQDEDFTVLALSLHVLGPKAVDVAVQPGKPFELSLEAANKSGGFRVSNRIRLLGTHQGTCEDNIALTLWDALPHNAAPCLISEGFVAWCGAMITQEEARRQSSYIACWCGSDTCSKPSDYNVLAARISASGAPVVVIGAKPGPWYRPVAAEALPPNEGSRTDEWPARVAAGVSVDVKLRIWTRPGVPGAGTAGPIIVSVCESRSRCMLPMEVFDLSSSEVKEASSRVSVGSTALGPKAIHVESRSGDPWLPEAIDVQLQGVWKRFKLGRWLLDLGRGASLEGPWIETTAPPRPQPPATDIFATGDECGGCDLGYACMERAADPLVAARAGPDSTAATSFRCVPACGDGLVVGNEQCDDGNVEDLDGCDSLCEVEGGFECRTEHGLSASSCRPARCSVGGAVGADTCGGSIAAIFGRDVADVCRSWDASLCNPGARASSAGTLVFQDTAFCVSEATVDAEKGTQRLCGRSPAHPQAVRADLTDGGRMLIVSFNAGIGGSAAKREDVACDAVLSKQTVALLGNNALCRWGSERALLVRLGFGAALGLENLDGDGNRDITVLGPVRVFYNTVPLPASSEAIVPIAQAQPLWAQPLREDMSLGETKTPTVVLRGALVATGGCGEVFLDASAIKGANGRPWKRVSWNCVGGGCGSARGSLPNGCENAGPDGAALHAGSSACGMMVRISESSALTIAEDGGTVKFLLTLTNADGLSGSGEHTVQFLKKRVPVAVGQSPSRVRVSADAQNPLHFEVMVRSATPAGTGPTCGSGDPGPANVDWRVQKRQNPGDDLPTQEELAESFVDFQPPNASLRLAGRPTVLSGTLGDYAVAGTSWLVVARVSHAGQLAPTATASPVFVPFELEVLPESSLSVSLEGPDEVSDDCPADLKAIPTGVGSDEVLFRWTCVRTDLVPLGDLSGAEAGACASAAAATGSESDTLRLPALGMGVYSIQVKVQSTSGAARGQATRGFFITVSKGRGPAFRFLEPAAPVVFGAVDGGSIRVKAALMKHNDFACLSGVVHAAVVAIGTAPGSEDSLVVDTQVIKTGLEMSAGLGDGQTPEDIIEVQMPLQRLLYGVPYRFQVLMATTTYKNDLLRHIALLNASDGSGATLAKHPPSWIWARESTLVQRSAPRMLALWVEPASGLAARTLFVARARTVCDGCNFAFRLARLDGAATVNATYGSCDSAAPPEDDTDSWKELREWGADPEIRMPLLQGQYLMEVRTKAPDGAMSTACASVDVRDPGTDQALASAKTAALAEVVVDEWVSDVTGALSTLRSQQQVADTLVSLHAIASECPTAESFQQRFEQPMGTALTARMQRFFRDVCVTVGEAIMQLEAKEFRPTTSTRRLAKGAPPKDLLSLAVDALLVTLLALQPLLKLDELTKAVGVVESVLARNFAVGGLLGSAGGASNAPPSGPQLLGVCGIALNVAADEAAGGRASAGNVAAARELAALSMQAVRELGDAAAAALPQDPAGLPVEIAAEGGSGIVLSVKHFPGRQLRLGGIDIILPAQAIKRPKYPGFRVSPMSPSNFEEYTTQVVRNTSTASIRCLGDGVSKLFDAVAFVSVDWARNPRGIGYAPGSLADPVYDQDITRVRDVHIRTCGVPLQIGSEFLGREEGVGFVFELPAQLMEDRSWGYGDVSPFRCVRWAGSDVVPPWRGGECRSVYRAPGANAPAGADGANLPMGALRCLCEDVWPTTWAVEVVPRPNITTIDESLNKSSHNVVSFGFGILWAVLIPLIFCAAAGDWLLQLDAEIPADKMADSLQYLPEGGAWEEAGAPLSKRCWPYGSEVMQFLVAGATILGDILTGGSATYLSLEARDLKRYRAALRAGQDPFADDFDGRGRSGRVGGGSATVVPEDDADLAAAAAAPALPPPTGGWRDKEAAATAIADMEAKRQGCEELLPAKKFGLADHAAAYKGVARGEMEDDLPPLAALEPPSTANSPRPEHTGLSMRQIVDRVNSFDPDASARQAAGGGAHKDDWDNQIRSEVARSNAGVLPQDALPEGWISKQSGSDTYYVNLLSGASTWETPMAPAQQVLSIRELRDLIGPKATHVSLRADLEEMVRPRIKERLAQMGLAVSEESDFWGPTPGQSRGGHGHSGAQMTLPGGVSSDRSHRELRPEAKHRAEPPAPLSNTNSDLTLPGGLSPVGTGCSRVVPCNDLRLQEESDGSQEEATGSRHLAVSIDESIVARPHPRRCFVADAQHQAAASAGPLRKAAQASDGMHALQDELDSDMGPSGIYLPLQLSFVNWCFPKLLWYCWLRSFPLLELFTPRLVLPKSRFRRASMVALRLASSLALAAGATAFQFWEEDAISENVLAARRETAELWAEVSLVLLRPATLILGVSCYILSAIFVMMFSVPPIGRAEETHHNRMVWWTGLLRFHHRLAILSVLMALLVSGAGTAASALSPQPRAAIALAAFTVMAVIYLVVWPLLATITTALLLRAAVTSESTLLAAILTNCPSLLDFTAAHVQWAVQKQYLAHAESVAAERKAAQGY
eukprot:TRINITY_DN24176_c0_g2_i1.p1 TRINITY_DN24176_c0_g2~~TRINITY_DN24176_c0_g2_i1.p1  ORF type:complete len:3462 (-),score=736.59 TRINITY_DN24176_c0_g2_i1:26-8887(-)